MGTTAKSGGDFKPAPAGNHRAVCCAVIDIGTQYSEKYGNSSDRIMIGWEIDERREDKDRFTLWREYTLSLGKKANLFKDLQTWRGRPFTKEELAAFEVKKVLGAPCMLNVIHRDGTNGNTYANVASIGVMPKGVDPLKAETQLYFNLDDEHDPELYAQIPEWIRKKIESSEQRKGTPAPAPLPTGPVGSEDDDDIAF